MVKKEGELYKCEICGFDYKKKDYADKCENYCSEHNACSLEIIKKAVK